MRLGKRHHSTISVIQNKTTAMTKNKTPETCQLLIKALPPMHDARELHTIITSSIHALFGEFQGENHCYDLKVREAEPKRSSSFIAECPESSVAAIRSALSMVTPPSYLSSTIYRFDITSVSCLD
jgi:hypothetical protein